MTGIIFDNYRIWLEDQKIPNGQKKTLLAGLDLFAKQGYDGTSTAQIAEYAGVSQATIFKYFKTKQDLLVAIIGPVMQNFFPLYRDDFLAKLKEFKTLREFVHFFVQNRYKFAKDNEDAVMILMTQVLVSPQVRKLIIDTLKRSDRSIPNEVGQILKNTGEIRSDLDEVTLVRTLIGSIGSYLIQSRFLGVKDEQHDLRLIEEQIISFLKK
ncbi:TetR/AcrR family transcriptional regulator [Pediococcus stilesii]|uniref:TetR family transcriptional regulator n=1 Tax=Pediococcus stilesii TaxID=331679 RepID=A0A0R2KV65_9LACO|nr:TetR/AcrR family transcriptional regulator [Pediococcus stilesii]KRN93394.1 TetR family transcriptional regulator [Pediococcus stilesii]